MPATEREGFTAPTAPVDTSPSPQPSTESSSSSASTTVKTTPPTSTPTKAFEAPSVPATEREGFTAPTAPIDTSPSPQPSTTVKTTPPTSTPTVVHQKKREDLEGDVIVSYSKMKGRPPLPKSPIDPGEKWLHQDAFQAHANIRSNALPIAMKFLDDIFNPHNCSTEKLKDLEYGVVDMGVGGGFAAHFQLAASDWMRALASSNFSKPILILGKIKGYSTVPACDAYNQEWTCYFKYLSRCQEEMIKIGRRVGIPTFNPKNGMGLIPKQFEYLGMAWWWGVLQRRMFRLRDNILKSVLYEGYKFREELGFPLAPPVGGVHVRHGDKRIDGFAERTLKAELMAIRASPENLATSHNTRGYAVTHEHFMNISFDLYVASDDKIVITEAKNGGFMTSPIGVSQEASSKGVFSTLNGKARGTNHGYNASIEIITDIFYLSHCSTLVGTASSQVYRMAVDMSNASGILEHAVAVDYNSLGRIKGMSAKWGLVVPEDFQKPPDGVGQRRRA